MSRALLLQAAAQEQAAQLPKAIARAANCLWQLAAYNSDGRDFAWQNRVHGDKAASVDACF
jgi:hypothetical protein